MEDLLEWTLGGLIGGGVTLMLVLVLCAVFLLLVLPLVVGGGLLALVLGVLLAGGLLALVAVPVLLVVLVLGAPVLVLGALLWWALRPRSSKTATAAPRIAA